MRQRSTSSPNVLIHVTTEENSKPRGLRSLWTRIITPFKKSQHDPSDLVRDKREKAVVRHPLKEPIVLHPLLEQASSTSSIRSGSMGSANYHEVALGDFHYLGAPDRDPLLPTQVASSIYPKDYVSSSHLKEVVYTSKVQEGTSLMWPRSRRASSITEAPVSPRDMTFDVPPLPSKASSNFEAPVSPSDPRFANIPETSKNRTSTMSDEPKLSFIRFDSEAHQPSVPGLVLLPQSSSSLGKNEVNSPADSLCYCPRSSPSTEEAEEVSTPPSEDRPALGRQETKVIRVTKSHLALVPNRAVIWEFSSTKSPYIGHEPTG
ncbi:hypothetical protein BJ684DRAFT_14360 [Piptocephalis cylindrospora]|uniref:Uncharacterized protein n=1 Tax=Piptocephalis cylindrospora TaxID=1907219 RepID=A0A4V1IYQ5_9FUNG|nr:hypothetical protein BJ684DRAFT_14360 [Piptocephalis cylindrospora]|eukprot:RKP15379.1 hypothetical protein BJ684DRAFT_14360 [Piptocephalis cylindrospora]